ncbi:MAG: hypothetical protein QE284_15970 [Rhizobium sp.]|nr:hypothetical protein [Rhizobium sp.]
MKGADNPRAAGHLAPAIWGHRQQSLNVASHYLGIELDGYDYEGDGHPQLASVPIEEHFLYTVVMDAYHHTYQCGDIFEDTFTVDEHLHEVAAIVTGFPQTDFNGEPTPLNELNPKKMRQVLETFLPDAIWITATTSGCRNWHSSPTWVKRRSELRSARRVSRRSPARKGKRTRFAMPMPMRGSPVGGISYRQDGSLACRRILVNWSQAFFC